MIAAAIDVAHRDAGEFPLIEVWANGEYEEGFDDRRPVLSIPGPASPTTPPIKGTAPTPVNPA